MNKLLSVVLGIFVAGASPAAELVVGDSYSLAPRVEDASSAYLLSENFGPSTHVFDGVAESIGESRYGPVGGTLSVEEDSFSVAPGIQRYVVEVTSLNVIGNPTPWVNYQWAGIGLIHWRLDVGSTYGGTDPIHFDAPVEVVDSGYSVFGSGGNWLGDYELVDTSTATSLSGVAIHSNGGQDIAGVDVATIQMWWDVRQPDAASPPTVATNAASSISGGGARLNGSADPNGASTNAWFQWGTSTAYGNATSPQTNVGSGTSAVSYSSNLSALQCGTTYHFRAVAQNSGGTAYGSDRSFTTSTCSTTPPTVVTSPARDVSDSGARLNGSADPNGATTNAWFQWGTSLSYGNVTSPQTNVGSGTSAVSYNFNLGALACGTTYFFRAVAQNSGGTAYGNARAFTTRACSSTPAPTVVTSPASNVSDSGARLNGTADPNGASTSAWFQWGTTTGYGNVTAGTSVGSGTSPAPYSSNLSALQCGTTYHFRAVAQNSGGTAYGSDRSFTTSACSTPAPTVVTSPASSIGETTARLNGSADPNGANTSAWFQWGTTTGYGNVTAGTSVGSGTSAVSYSSNLSALQCGTTYHFRAVAQNSGGTAYGSNRSFTTSTCTEPPPVEEEVIVEYGFETASSDGWKSKGKVSIDGILAIDQFSLRHENGAESVYSVSTAGYQDVSITMHLAATSLQSGDACFAEVSTDGGDSWMSVVTLQNGQDSGAFYSGTVFPPEADDSLDVRLRFRASGRGNKGYCYGDEVYVMGTPIGG